MRFGFKEWAVICRALAAGRQALILRKGGIAEEDGVFRPDHARFWLLPTYLHQNADGLKPAAAVWLPEIERERPPTDVIRLTHFAEVPGVFRADRLDALLELDRLHVWSEATVRQRFTYRQPGLFVLPVRVFALAEPVEVPNRPEYDGCKTWVDFGSELPTNGQPVLSDRAFADVLEVIERTP
ncbi:MAG TPA: DUF1802 family protein [Gemmataceae bacterium]|jgi:hypothetical protein|nr:DUF1802 family protein [Gemmataceae bacterium]